MQQSATRQRPHRDPYSNNSRRLFHPCLISSINKLRPPNLTISCCYCCPPALRSFSLVVLGRAFGSSIRVAYMLYINFIPHVYSFICSTAFARRLRTPSCIRVHNRQTVISSLTLSRNISHPYNQFFLSCRQPQN